MYTPINPSFTIHNWFKGVKLYRYVFLMLCKNVGTFIKCIKSAENPLPEQICCIPFTFNAFHCLHQLASASLKSDRSNPLFMRIILLYCRINWQSDVSAGLSLHFSEYERCHVKICLQIVYIRRPAQHAAPPSLSAYRIIGYCT